LPRSAPRPEVPAMTAAAAAMSEEIGEGEADEALVEAQWQPCRHCRGVYPVRTQQRSRRRVGRGGAAAVFIVPAWQSTQVRSTLLKVAGGNPLRTAPPTFASTLRSRRGGPYNS